MRCGLHWKRRYRRNGDAESGNCAVRSRSHNLRGVSGKASVSLAGGTSSDKLQQVLKSTDKLSQAPTNSHRLSQDSTSCHKLRQAQAPTGPDKLKLPQAPTSSGSDKLNLAKFPQAPTTEFVPRELFCQDLPALAGT